MNVLVIGATGYLGSAITEALRTKGHEVRGLARSTASAEKLAGAGVEVIAGDVKEPERLRAVAPAFDAVVYAVQYGGAGGPAVETAALHALVETLSPGGKALLYTSGVWLYGNTAVPADESTPPNPPQLIAHRPQLERIVLDGALQGLRAIVIRPGDVYGRGGGIPATFVDSAVKQGAAVYVGDGESHWPVVHRDDLAQLFVLALERAGPGAVFNANDETAPTVREIAAAASRGAGRGGATKAWPLEDARRQLGLFADALVLDQRITSRRARSELGWTTRTTTILDDLERGSYVPKP